MSSKIDKSLMSLQPLFRAKVEKLINDCKAEKIDLYINETLRSFERQTALYAQGRTKPGNKVTNAVAGQSNHHFGLALDVYPRINGDVIFNFDQVPAAMKIMERVYKLAEKNGLECGAHWASFTDLPHLQEPGLDRHALLKVYPQGYIPGKSKPVK